MNEAKQLNSAYAVEGQPFLVYLCDECARTYHTTVTFVRKGTGQRWESCRECWKRVAARHAPKEQAS